MEPKNDKAGSPVYRAGMNIIIFLRKHEEHFG